MITLFQLHRLLLLPILCTTIAFGQLNSVRSRIDSIARQARGSLGLAVIDLGSGDTLTVRGHDRFPMQSVYKFPLALTVLNRVDKGFLSLTQSIYVPKEDLPPDTWSPLRERYPDGAELPLDTILRYTVAFSDNNGCDILFRLIGGPEVVNRYVHDLGILEMMIVSTEAEMHQAWGVQYRNWTSPLAMATLLRLFESGDILSRESRDYLWDVMANSNTAPRRMKGLLPPDATVAHKSGSSGINPHGIAAATNDVGIVVLPGGRRVVVAVFVSDSPADGDERDFVIASITRTVWEAYAIQN